MARRRRTSNIQRRERASSEALARRLDERPGLSGLPDWRLLAIGGLLVVGVIVVILALVLGSGPNPSAGTIHPNDGQQHVSNGACRDNPASCQLTGNPYSSLPATSGPHWNAPANWGAYTTPQQESQLIHNLEHGGIVIWYDPERVEGDGVADLAQLVQGQVAEGVGGRFKFILSPWGGAQPLGAPIAVTSWRYLLELETLDIGAIESFADEHYGIAPEPGGGPLP